MLDYCAIGSRIRQYRKGRGMTQEDLAFQIKTTTAYISYIERGLKKPSLEKLVVIADVLQVTINDFIYTELHSSNINIDLDFQYMMSLCTLENQKIITKNIAEILQILLTE